MSPDKTIVLITGGNGGIGYLTAERLAALSPDYHVIIASRNQEQGEKALSELRKENPKGSFALIQLDVTDQESITAAAEFVEKQHGRLDILINNAGIIPKTTPLINNLREGFGTNTFGPAVVTEAFTPLLEKSKNARLIYVTSGLGSITDRLDPSNKFYKLSATTYRMNKAALNMLAACHHVELGPKGIKVWAFDPGYVVTNLSGTGEKGIQERIANGAGDPKESAEGIVDCVDGRRDNDVGKFVHKDGFYLW
ncbi:short chain dehydrogenase [Hyaloscypha sp. PMI_1271]|nr:short chain dehydrogenase [Hyaloscypha sp. PMI_1271]